MSGPTFPGGTRRRFRRFGAGGALLSVALLASAMLPAFLPVALAVPITTVDTGGADDQPGQKDLNFMVVDYAVAPGTLDVGWAWDDTATSGANTRDACALFDTDDDGFANYAFCVIVAANDTETTQLYECDNTRSDRCAGASIVASYDSTATTDEVVDSDPFGVPSSPHHVPEHVTGNTCSDQDEDCYTVDTVADATIDLDDFGGADAFLLNVCAYPSQQPNSAPSDCVVAPDSGFLTIVKDAGTDTTTNFVFNLPSGQTSADGTASWTLTGSDTEASIPFIAGTYSLDEAVPTGWILTDADCELQVATPANTGTADTLPAVGPTSAGVNSFAIQAGIETICTFTDLLADPELTIVKTATVPGDADGTIDSPADNISYSILVSNTGNVTLTGVSVSDPLISDLDCDPATAGNQTTGFTIAVGGSLTCTGTYDVTQADIDNNGGGDGDIDNTATADSTQTAAVQDSEEVPILQSPAMTIVKTATVPGDADGTIDSPADNISYSILVSNTGTVTLTGVSVSDPLISDLDCDPATAGNQTTGFTIAVGGSLTCTGTYDVTQADIDNNGGGDGDIDNTATADSTQTAAVQDSEEVPILQSPAMTIVKTATVPGDADGTIDSPADNISYSILVSNTGTVTLTGVSVSDPLISDLDCDPATAGNQTTGFTIAVGGSLTCTGTYDVTQADIDNNGGGDGDIDNTATADSTQTAAVQDSEEVPILQSPAMTIVKTATVPGDADGTIDSPADNISYSILVSNTGNVTLTGVSVSDPLISDLDCDPATAGNQTTGFTIAVGGSLTCTGTYDVTQADIDNNGGGDGDIDNTATADSTQTAAVQDSEEVPILQSPAMTIVKTATVPGDADGTIDSPADNISYSILVSNTGTVTLTGVSVSDPLISDLDCDPATAGNQTTGFTIAVGGSLTCTGTYDVTQADIDNNGGGDGDIDNTATADSTQTAAVQDSEEVPILQSPAMTIVKTATVPGDADGTIDSPADNISYSILVSNTGTVTLTGVSVSDPLISDLDCDPATAGNQTTGFTIAVGGSLTCTGTYDVTQADIDNNGGGDGDIDNTATADSTQTAAVQDSEEVPILQSADIDIEKATNGEDADSPTGPVIPVGGAVTWTYVVTNTGNVALTNITVTDSDVAAADIDCDTSGDNTIASLAPGASEECEATGTATAGQYANTGTATDGNVSDTDDSHYFGADPDIDIEKATNGEDADSPTGPVIPVGGAVTWTYVVTNTGNVALTNITVTDSDVAAADIDCDTSGDNTIASLAPGASEECEATGTATAGQYANTGTATDGNVSDTDDSHYFGEVPDTTDNLFHTGTTCQQYLGTAPDGPGLAGTGIEFVNYTLNRQGTAITQTDPGVFFYYSTVEGDGGDLDVTIEQTPPSGYDYPFAVQNAKNVKVYDANCNTFSDYTVTSTANGDVTLTINDTTAGADYIISVKYDTSLRSKPAPPANVGPYTFESLVGNVVVDSDAEGITLQPR